jgi:hypothetical protein
MNKITRGLFLAKSKITINGLVLLFALLLMNTQTSWGQLLNENFSYTIGTDLTSNGWAITGSTASPTVAVTAASITYPGYLSSGVGEGVSLATSGQDVNKSFASQTTGTIYASFLVNVTSATTTGDYFFNVGASTIGTTFKGRIFVKKDASNNVSFGIAINSAANYSSAIYALNTTYLIVLKYDIVSGLANDTASIFVNPPLNSVIPSTGWIANTDASGTDLANVGSIALRQGSASNAAGLKLDGIRVSTTWSDIVGIVTSTTWNGTTWSNGAPTATVEAIIDGTYNTNVGGVQGPFIAKKLTVNSGKSLTINSGTNVTVQNEVINGGTLVVENNANLIQVNDVANTGAITVNRNSNLLKRLDYTLWSSPVASQNLIAFSPLTSQSQSRFYTFDTTYNTDGVNGAYSAIENPSLATSIFAAGAGYLIRMPNTDPLAEYDAGTATLAYPGVFTGLPNNGDVPVTLNYIDAQRSYNLVGNPYPSVIDANTFIATNSTNIESTLYFWRKTNGSGTAYAAYNPAGGVLTYASTTSDVPNGKIQVGQGFFVQAKNAVTIPAFFTNAMREAAPTSTQFFKTKKVVEKDRVWLNLTNTTGVFSQVLVAYIADATLGIDNYDGKYFNDSPIALTSNINNEEYTIQGRPAFDVSDVVALNFKTDLAGDYTIAIDHADGLFANNQDVYLVDSKTGVETNLKTSSYTFAAVSGIDNTRFSLKYQKTLKVDAPVFNENSVTVYNDKGVIFVNSRESIINNIKVYDVQGRLIAEQKEVKASTATINNLKAIHQVLIVKVTSEDNKVISKKVAN